MYSHVLFTRNNKKGGLILNCNNKYLFDFLFQIGRSLAKQSLFGGPSQESIDNTIGDDEYSLHVHVHVLYCIVCLAKPFDRRFIYYQIG